ncbi:hypothetical protein PR003_g4648 [Phytophthora rubi]|uniref:Uncharacterized protein n=1 Tax=Phytophthora rubi TaxID=129364 RepID=A0A6A4FLR3_9STRA|nr:hypothetical protein PR002_g5889 [Phytophthora rubi]KAE9044323.1 hypothetical protein PR001_g5418 [Phytophthora rubi]KAE9351927.1 hypothetical protein PR003_g4648 [Phytophthora rubi]
MRRSAGTPSSGHDGPGVLPPRMTASQIRCVGIPRASYPPFRESFFFDPRANTALKKGGRPPDRRVYARDSRRMWTTQGPSIDPRLPKTTVQPGTAFRNECLSADQLYSSNRNSLGYDVHRSLRGTSLCSTTKRFAQKNSTPECVGPGSYDVMKKPKGLLTDPPPPKQGDVAVPDRLGQWGGRPDSRSMDSAGEWKHTSEIPSVTKFSFRKARASTWIEQVEQRQRREDPLARRKPKFNAMITPEQRLPHYLQGTSNPVYTHTPANFKAGPHSAPEPVRPLVLSLFPNSMNDDSQSV